MACECTLNRWNLDVASFEVTNIVGELDCVPCVQMDSRLHRLDKMDKADPLVVNPSVTAQTFITHGGRRLLTQINVFKARLDSFRSSLSGVIP